MRCAAPARASSIRARRIPGLRLAQKYAVRAGGGGNHRMGLYDAVMLKENHVRAAGSIAAAIAAARATHPALPLIVEVETLRNSTKRCATGCDRILIDDFDADDAPRGGAHRAAPFGGAFRWKCPAASTCARVRAIAEDGVDYISIGALTKHVRAIDLSMKLGRRAG